MNSAFTQQLADIWADILNTRPKRIFGADSDLLRNEAPDDHVPQPGYVGRQYRRGGVVFVGRNPGGAEGKMTAADVIQLPLLRKLRHAKRAQRIKRFQELNRHLRSSMPEWNVCGIVEQVLNGIDADFDAMAYLNLVKWRTRGERLRGGVIWRSWTSHTHRQINTLKPSAIVILGLSTRHAFDRIVAHESPAARSSIPPVIAIPRVIKDGYSPPHQKKAIRATIRFLKERL